jgi:serine/threonine-protein kinase
MGEVYRARDPKLDRDVAIKILPEAVASDPERIARFEREARTLAALNHPNIAQIYGVEESDSVRALVMELVEGPTLADRIAQGPIPIDESLAIAKQIARALEAAHEQGIVHRDLKPANIKVREDGTVKVLDFGLAKALEPVGSADPARLSMSPTITSPVAMTGIGTLVGTAAYMSPEQAKGRPADKRSDVWAFGCVLYEILTSKPAFAGEDISDTLANILKREPDWTILPSELTVPLVLLVQRCLEKNRNARTGDISAALFVLDEPRLTTVGDHASEESWRPSIRMLGMSGVALLAGALLAAAVVRRAPATHAGPERSIARFRIPLGSGEQFSATGRHLLALSPDGSRLVFAANRQLYLRPLDRLDAVPLRGTMGTSGGRSPFFSPDGKWIGFWNDGKLRKVLVNGGTPVDICDAENPYGASWADDNTILYGAGERGIFRVSAGGGKPEVILADLGGAAHGPQLLPGGRSVLFTVREGGNSWDDADIVVQSIDTGKRDVIVRGGTDGRYLESGHIVYVAGGTLFALPFDLASLKASGGPVALIEGVAQSPAQTGSAHFSVSRTGTLAYIEGSFRDLVLQKLAWIDRAGRETEIAAPARNYLSPRISPDGKRLAVQVRTRDDDHVWIWDFARETFTPLTSGRDRQNSPVWTPDGRRIAFGSGRTGDARVHWQLADGSGSPEALSDAPMAQLATSFSPDGTQLVFMDPNRSALMLLSIKENGRISPLVEYPGISARSGAISPDGRWLAYDSNESGPPQVFIRRFPNTAAGRWQVSSSGGTLPVWSRDGRELFYLAPSGGIMHVGVNAVVDWASSAPAKIVDLPSDSTANLVDTRRGYDVSPQGERFLLLKPAPNAQPARPPDTIVLVQNWFEELRARVPVK